MLLAIAAILAQAAVFVLSTPQFAAKVRAELISTLEQATGGRVELAAIHWNVWHLAFEVNDLTIHGLEAPSEVPYAHVDRLYIQLKLLALLRPRAGVRVLEIEHPVLHLIVYKDGTTNQPSPKKKSNADPRDTINSIFDLQAGRVSIWNGYVLFNQRSVPFSFSGKDLSLLVRYVPSVSSSANDNYVADLTIADITTSLMKQPEVHSRLQGELVLGRNLAQIQSLQWSTLRSGLTLQGKIENYLAPSITMEAHGKADLRDVAYMADVYQLTGGVAHLDMQAHGTGLDDLLATGQIHLTGGAYKDPYFQIRNVGLETVFSITGKQIVASHVRANAAGGVIVDGSFSLTNWLNQPDALNGKKFPKADEPHAEFGAGLRAIVLPQVLRTALSPQYSELGFNATVTGTGSGGWNGDPRGVFVTAQVALDPLQGPDGVPTSGSVVATYTGVNDFVDIRTLHLETPASTLEAQGTLDVGLTNSHTSVRADLTTSDLAEFNHVLAMVGVGAKTANPSSALPIQLHGQAGFHGQLQGPLELLRVSGHLDVVNFATVLQTAENQKPQALQWDALHTDLDVAPESLSVAHLSLTKGTTSIHADGSLQATAKKHNAYAFDEHSAVQANVQLKNASVAELEAITGQQALPVTGTLSLNAKVSGLLDDLQGGGHLTVAGGTIYDEPYKSVNADLVASHSDVGVANLVFAQNGGKITGKGGYDFVAKSLHADLTGSGFELAHIQQLQKGSKPVGGALNFHVAANGTVAAPSVTGDLTLKDAMLGTQNLGGITAKVYTENHVAFLDASSDMLQSNVQLHGQVALKDNYVAQATLTLGKFDAEPLLAIFAPQATALHTVLEGNLKVSGPLKTPKALDIDAALDTFQMKYDPYTLSNQGPLRASVHHGVVQIDAFHITGQDTDLTAHGTADITGGRDLNMQVKGAVNLAVLQLFNKNFVSSGHIDLSLDADGSLDKPGLHGKVVIANGNLADIDFPNGLSKMNGTLEFNEDRLEVRKLTAITGGGTVSLGGFLTYERGFYADITATAKDVRVRYPAGLSSTADASLHLAGSNQQATLSGNVQLTRFGLLGSLGVGGGTGAAAIAAPPDPDSLESHILLDVHLTSAPELNFENSYATLAGQVDLHIRGSVAAPSVLGKVLITEGDAELAGTKYQLQRGQIYFSNPVRIDPIIDLDATAQVRDYDISLGVHGTLEKLNTTYRSEPPLPQADIIALLALGRTQEEAQIYQQEQADAGVDSTTNALLGGALNATVSNRVQKLFGVGQVKIDPNFVGSLGQSTARVTVTQQLSKQLTLTYATNVNETSQQLIQASYAINRDVSLVAVRDEAGVFSLLVHIRQRHR